MGRKAAMEAYIDRRILLRFQVSVMLIFVTSLLPNLLYPIIAGNYISADAITVFGLYSPLQRMVYSFFMLISIGGAMMAAFGVGTGDKMAPRRYFTVTLVSVIVLMSALSVLLLLLRNPLAALFCGSFARLQPLAAGYIGWMTLDIFPYGIFCMMDLFITMDGHEDKAVAATAVTSILSLSLAFVLAKYSSLGICSLAVSQIVGDVAGSLFLLMYLFSEHCSFKPVGVRGHFLSCIKESIPHGATYFAASILLAVALFMMNKSMLNVLTGVEAASWGVVFSLMNFCTILSGASGVVCLLYGEILTGEGHWSGLRMLVRRSTAAMAAISTIVFLAIGFFLEPLLGVYGIDAGEIGRDSAILLRMSAVLVYAFANCALFAIFLFVLGKNVMYVKRISLIYFIPAALSLLASLTVPDHIAAVFPVVLLGETALFLDMGSKVRKEIGKLDVKHGYLNLSIEYNFKAIGRNLAEIRSFLRSRNVPEDLAERIEHCVDEMSYNIIKHRPGRYASMSFDVRLNCTDKEVVVFVLDEGTPYNPVINFQDTAYEAGLEGRKMQLSLRVMNHYAGESSYKFSFGVNMTRFSFPL